MWGSLKRFAGNPRNLALHMFVDHLRQMLVEPLLEDRTKHLADHVLERVDGRRRGNGRGDSLQFLERLATVAGGVLIGQSNKISRPDVDAAYGLSGTRAGWSLDFDFGTVPAGAHTCDCPDRAKSRSHSGHVHMRPILPLGGGG